jgi:hypothetical protein
VASVWSREEVEAIVSDYFDMLKAELRGASYSKAEHRRHLLAHLRARSEQSVEFKHANISAVLIELGFPFISGYKPRSNYQGMLYDVVSDRLGQRTDLVQLVAADADRVVAPPPVDDILGILTDPPARRRPTGRSADRVVQYMNRPASPGTNYLELEARNRSLGTAGEEFVLRFEQARLIRARCEQLAARVEHVSRVRGDGEGFDVLSFEASGAERLIEVKTTKYGRETPFFVSRNELRVSRARADRYHLYRVFEFRAAPGLFTLPGALSDTCDLDPNSYVATVA